VLAGARRSEAAEFACRDGKLQAMAGDTHPFDSFECA
jgi:hypothetical protein